MEDKRKFPDSTFSASASSEGHSASDARITSGSSWCAPVSDEKHYLQVDLRTLHEIHSVITYGDSTSTKWVVTYNLNYTVDFLNWETSAQVRKVGITNMYTNLMPRYSLFMMYLLLYFVGISRKQKCLRLCSSSASSNQNERVTIHSISICWSTMHES